MDHSHHMNGPEKKGHDACCTTKKRRFDWLLWSMLAVIIAAYAVHYLAQDSIRTIQFLPVFTLSVFELINTMWHGILLGIVFVGVLAGIPRELVQSVIGKGGTVNGVLRATAGGILLDLCSHGILLVGMQLYKRGASLGQVMAFLIASPWNSISLTVILWALVGLKWTLIILGLSMIIAIVSGVIFDKLVDRKVLPANPNKSDPNEENHFKVEFSKYWNGISWKPSNAVRILDVGIKESRMILRWIFFGIVLAALIRTFVSPELFKTLFGPTLMGLGATLIFATILEVCSEGSMPVAADFLLRAKAPGNTFAFLMTGVSTDYTEILSIKETTGSWKTAFFLPLVTFPQVVVLAIVLNQMAP